MVQSEPGDSMGGSPLPLTLLFHSVSIIFHSKPPSILYSIHLISNKANPANELCKITFSKLSVKTFLAKTLSDHLNDLTTHS